MALYLLSLAIFLLLTLRASSQQCKDVALVKSVASRAHWSHDDVELIYGNVSNYRLIKRLGVGTFGEAYLALNAIENYMCVIKIFRDRMSYSKMIRELLVMQSLCGGTNIVKLYDVVQEGVKGLPATVIEYVNFTDHRILYPSFTQRDVKYYMRELLKAIDFTHQHEVIHRDIKPHNVLIDPNNRILRLIDFGLSRFHYPGTNHTDAGTVYYMAPEVLLGHKKYDVKADMWSFGVMFAGIIFQKQYFFKGNDRMAQLHEYVKVMGSDGLIELAESLDIPVDRNASHFKHHSSISWEKFVTDQNKHLATKDSIYALSKILRYNPGSRYSASDVLRLPFFM